MTKTRTLKPWRVVATTNTYEDAWLKVRSDTCARADGHVITPYHVLSYPDWVNVVAVTPRFEIVLVRQYRHAVSEILLELPCGALDRADKDPSAGAARELAEETGYVASDCLQVGPAHANPATHSNSVWTVVAINARKMGESRPDANEDIEVVLVNVVEFVQRVLSGAQRLQGLHIAALWLGLSWIARSTQPDLAELRGRLAVSGALGGLQGPEKPG